MKIKVKNSGVVKLNWIKDKEGDGDIFVAEAAKHVPFKIKRVFFITAPKKGRKSVRGRHAHKKTRRAIFCITGTFVLNLDDGETRQRILMKDPATGILLGSGLWHTMSNISGGCCILVLADDFYHEADYIRDYNKFLRYIAKTKKSK